jgi:DNA-binding NarL/FixJ family response regulator
MDDKKSKLSATEMSIIKMIEKGMSSKEIAIKTDCSARTIEKHRSNIIKKLKLPKGSRLELWIMKQHAKDKHEDGLLE